MTDYQEHSFQNYDLITKKSITNIKLSLFYFAMAISIYTLIFAACDINKEEYVIVAMLEENSWYHGNYFFDFDKAYEYWREQNG